MTSTTKQILGIAAGFGAAALVLSALYWRGAMERGLPPKTETETRRHAMDAAMRYALEHGGSLTQVLGTGSMAPYIPAQTDDGAAGRATVVAIVVTHPTRRFEDVRPGDLCTYRPEQAPHEVWLHQAAQRDGDGWIMSGLANPRSESWMRVTRANFVGVVAHTWTWRQSEP